MLTKENMMKTIFSQALEPLLEERELEEIHTSEIIKKSGLAKSSFYRYFQDKYDLATWMLERVLEGQSIQLTGPEEQEDNVKGLLLSLDAKRPVYQRLFKYKGQNSITDYYMNFGITLAKKACKAKGTKITKRDEYMVRYHMSGILELIAEWLFDPNPMSPEELTAIIRENNTPEVRKLFTT